MSISPRIALVLLLALSFTLNLIPIWWGLPGYPTWAPDELLSTQVVPGGHWPLKYPQFHRYLLLVVYLPLDRLLTAVATEDDFLTRMSILQTAGRIVSLLMATAITWLTYRYGRLLVSRRAALLGAAIVAFSAPMVYYAKTVNLEAPYLFWFTVSLIFLLKAARDGRLRDHLLFGVTAALAVGSKDQAYALYLASPVILLWGSRRRALRDSPSDDPPALLADRGLWSAILAGALTLSLIYRLPFDFDLLIDHVRIITGPKSANFQTFEHSVTGHAEMLLQAVTNFNFALGLPWLVALVVGIALSLRDEEKRWKFLGVSALAVGYYLGFISVIGYHYVRFFLPLVILAAPIAGWGLLQALDKLGWQRVAPALVALALLFNFARAVAVDAAMVGDSRYEVESFLATEGLSPAVGMGRRRALPRGLPAVEWKLLATAECGAFEEEPTAIVVNATDLRDDLERSQFRALGDGFFGLDPVFRHPERPGVPGLQTAGVDSNLSLINPDLRVFARARRRCLDDDTLLEYLVDLQSERTERSAAILAEAIRTERLAFRRVGRTPTARAVNLRPDKWTYGTQPAATLLENLTDNDAVAWLRVGCWAPSEAYPVVARIDDGRSVREVRFTRDGPKTVTLRPLVPGEAALVVVWTDTAWKGREPNPRLLGVKLLDVGLQPASASDAG